MTTRNVVTAFIIFLVGIMLGRCSAPAPPPPGDHVDVKTLSNEVRECIYSNLPSIHTGKAFDFVVADCQASKKPSPAH